ncbi:MAG: L,D-transpeptidase [Chloroflexota bacterium]
MSSKIETARQLIRDAKKALERGDRMTARQLAQRATILDSRNLDAWLILGGLSDPRGSLIYLKRALELAPRSQRVREAIHWAIQRLRKSPEMRWSIEYTQPRKLEQQRRLEYPQSFIRVRRSPVWLWSILASLLICGLILGFGFLPIDLAAAQNNRSAYVPTNLFKPSLTPTPTNTPTPTPTPTATPTPTNTPTPTPTSTATPVPTATNTNPPIVTTFDDGKWIDIDLSAQRLFAYEGEEVVRSFLISTGTSAHPTVTGQYHVYVKYRYTDMAGPGYYLPDVPYTMYFYSGYGIHGTYWHDNFGTPMSHGCVNMRTSEAGWLYDWAFVGILVNIHH